MTADASSPHDGKFIQQRLVRSAASASAATMTSRILGLVRDQVLASMFGAGNAMDAFNVAFRIPNLARDLFAEGALSAAFVPEFMRRLTVGGKASAWRLGSSVINCLLIVTSVLVIAGLVFVRPLINLFASDYAAVPGKLELTILLTRLMLPFLTCVSVAAAVMGMLNALQLFFVPALAPAVFNLATIACALLVVPVMANAGWPPIAGIAIGTLIGGMAQVTLQWPLLRRQGFVHTAVLDWKDEGLRRVLLLMGPGTFGLAATQVNVLVNTILATGQGTGAVSWLNYAFRLMYLPIGLFGVSVGTATLPSISHHAARRDTAAIRATLAEGLSLMLVLNIPATVGLVVLATPIVRLIFERNAFLPIDTAATAASLQLYAIGLVGYSIVRIATPTFYALGNGSTPVKISAASVIVNAALNMLLVRFFGYRGLALGTSVSALINAAALLWILRRRLEGLDERRVGASFVRIVIASALMGMTSAVVAGALARWAPAPTVFVQVSQLFVTILTALVVLGVSAYLLRIREFRHAVAFVTQRGWRDDAI